MALGLILLFPVLMREASAQAPLFLVNDETTVRRISFKFTTTETFTEDRLESQIVLTEPGFLDRVRRILPLLDPSPHPFSPVELQKDVVRLRRFYRQNGFLEPRIDYAASQLDTTKNTIHVIFSIDEGPPVIIQDVGFYGPDGRFAYYQFPDERQNLWIRFRNAITVHTGDRYTDFDRLRIQDEALTWLKDRGYAFARVEANARIDSTAHTADLRFTVDTGPLAYFDTFEVEGNESVDRNVILRELPFQPGDRFSNRRLVRGQRELFSLNLFRLALADVPEQPRDSTVHVRIRVREAKLRYVTAQGGYARYNGVGLQGEWAHRNFFGGARTFVASLVWNTGTGALPPSGIAVAKRFRATVSLRQPYLFTTKLSGIVAPYYLWENDKPLMGQEVGLNSTLVYEVLPFRVVSFQHTFARASVPNLGVTEDVTRRNETDLFSRSIFTLSATLGKVDNYVTPSRGFLVRPFAEAAGYFLASDIDYSKFGSEFTLYQPLTDRTALNVRFMAGQILLIGDSQYDETEIFNPRGFIPPERRRDALLENRFDRIRFYAGGGNDVRGWHNRQIGPVVARADTVFVDEDGKLQARYRVPGTSVYGNPLLEELGGLAKLAGNIEVRLPFPGLGPSWSSAAFLDFGQVFKTRFGVQRLRYAVGGGLRYQSVVGIIRLDLGYKLNPTLEDLNTPEEIFLYRNGYIDRDDLSNSFLNRFALHLSIGQVF